VEALLKRISCQTLPRVADRLRPCAGRRVRFDQLLQCVEPALLPALALQPQPLLVPLAVADAEAVEERPPVQRDRRFQALNM